MSDQDTSAFAAEETEEERQEREDAEEFRALQAKYGKRIAVYKDDDFGRIVIAVKGKRKQYQRLVNSMQDKNADSAVALEQFALDCVVEPSRKEAQAIFEEYPALATRASGRASELAGGAVKELGKD